MEKKEQIKACEILHPRGTVDSGGGIVYAMRSHGLGIIVIVPIASGVNKDKPVKVTIEQ